MYGVKFCVHMFFLLSLASVGGIVSVPEVLRAVAAALDPTADHAHMDASEGGKFVLFHTVRIFSI